MKAFATTKWGEPWQRAPNAGRFRRKGSRARADRITGSRVLQYRPRGTCRRILGKQYVAVISCVRKWSRYPTTATYPCGRPKRYRECRSSWLEANTLQYAQRRRRRHHHHHHQQQQQQQQQVRRDGFGSESTMRARHRPLRRDRVDRGDRYPGVAHVLYSQANPHKHARGRQRCMMH
jgi:hypothetical protein